MPRQPRLRFIISCRVHRVLPSRARQADHEQIVPFVGRESYEDCDAIPDSQSVRLEPHHTPGFLCTWEAPRRVLN
eukprot:3765203-Pyramimonas_sp.AAC.1